jgi:retron-type reverse transcriptase
MQQPNLFEPQDREKLLLHLFRAYYDARQNKRNKHSALLFELHYEHELFWLAGDILAQRYHPKPSICFIIKKPVKREVFAADFRDRIVHHLILNYISPVFEGLFINDSYSCRKGKGTHYGIKRLEHFVRSCSENYHSDCYILKIDIQGYFMSIDRSLLYEKIKSRLLKYSSKIDGDLPTILYLIRATIFNDPVNGCIMKSRRSEWNDLPATKSLFHAPENKGLPIGNLTSQLFANIYLNEFDHFMKRGLQLQYYRRYVDDIVVVHRDLKHLKSVVPVIGDYLLSNLELRLHPRKIYLQHYSKGVAFLGTVIKPYRTYISARTQTNLIRSVTNYNQQTENHLPTPELLKQFVSGMNSYLGILIHYKTAKLREKVVKTQISAVWSRFFYASGRYRKLVKRNRNLPLC